ncbi:MAG: hypothetical protein Q8J97_15875, partial [Flavobacteriaceae bacterium]|nr:hypothetical protein [Flavobacteriaceae bacterium]
MNNTIHFKQTIKMIHHQTKQTISRMIFSLALGIGSMFIFSSCDTEETLLAFNDIPVVESYLIMTKPVSIQITRKTPYDANVALSDDNLDLLQVKILYNDQIRLIPSVGNGEY